MIKKASEIIGDFKAFPIKKEALKLKGVKHLKIALKKELKLNFIEEIYFNLSKSMTMIFVNTK